MVVTAPLLLNLGSGDHPTPEGWVAVDVRDDCVFPPHIRAHVEDLPYENGSVSRIYAGHLFEHIPLEGICTVLHEWERVLAPDGIVGIVGPDIDRAVEQNEPDWILKSIVRHGGPPAGHAWSCSETVLRYLLDINGWLSEPRAVSDFRPPEWPNPEPDARWQLALLASPRR